MENFSLASMALVPVYTGPGNACEGLAGLQMHVFQSSSSPLQAQKYSLAADLSFVHRALSLPEAVAQCRFRRRSQVIDRIIYMLMLESTIVSKAFFPEGTDPST